MTETKFTPGPWKLTRRDGAPHGDSDNLGWDWASGHPDENTPPEPMRGIFVKEADARLVMAAPEMFEALKRMDEFWHVDHPAGPDGDPTTMGGLAVLTDETLDVWRCIRAALSKALGKEG